jgi:hypothetical protein
MMFEFSSVARSKPAAGSLAANAHDVNAQRLRILRCTAKAMVSGPGGLRFTAGARPWLVGLTDARSISPPAATDLQMSNSL